ncbi:MAG TPA: acyl-CoA dehydrogenase, partial [Myxococcales bacterium]|nr:acyl-CoA dehydrogenase [Myxococcales bacterium]
MHIELSEEQLMIQEAVRDFAREAVLPIADECDKNSRFPSELMGMLGELGAMGVSVPEKWGGHGLDHVTYVLIIEELSAACASVGVTASVNNSLVCDPLSHFGTDEQKKRFLIPLAKGEQIGCFALSEPGTGSDAANQQATCVREGDDWILNGTKNFITNGPIADVIIVFAMNDRSLGTRGICAFVLPMNTPGVSCGAKEHKLGIKGSPCSSVIFDEVRVGED